MKRSNESDFILQNNQIQINFRDCFPQSDLNPVNSQIWVGENSLKVSLILQQPLWGNSGIFVSIYFYCQFDVVRTNCGFRSRFICYLSLSFSQNLLRICSTFNVYSLSKGLTEDFFRRRYFCELRGSLGSHYDTVPMCSYSRSSYKDQR